jgi:hypothetical protein
MAGGRPERCPAAAIGLIPAGEKPNLEDLMAEHAEVEYATATGNDYAEHEQTYERFLHLTFVLIIHVINILLGLGIGGVMGHWLTAFLVFVVAIVGGAHGALSNSKTSSIIALVISLVAFAFSTAG